MKAMDQQVVNSIRILSAEQVQAAKSGHPGMPMGAAPQAFALWDRVMVQNPANPKWKNRDRFVLSSGHASAMLYSLLHLYGFGLTIDDLKRFRQVGSKTPGHPEYGHTVGVETTTGPLGQGVANAVGFALAEAYLAEKFNRPGFAVVDHYTYAMCGDGCMMEGITSEAASLAGTLKLGKLVLLYDANRITIEGDTDLAFREDVAKRFEAYGWHVQRVQEGNDVEAIEKAVLAAKADERPSLVIVHSTIGYGCKDRAGKASAHGEPLGEQNLAAAKQFLDMPEEAFMLPEGVYEHTASVGEKGAKAEADWNTLFAAYDKQYPELAAEYTLWHSEQLPVDLLEMASFWQYEGKAATRNSSGEALNRLAAMIPNLIGGSADLSPSNKSVMKGKGEFSAEDHSGANLHFGIREHAMAAICNGMVLHGGLRVYCATFFVFTDYMKNAMRLSAMMKLPLTYILTHDSIGVGEDGPTHQPVEHLAGLRAIPNLLVIRPADSREVAAAWTVAMTDGRPTCIVSTRQDLPLYEKSGKDAMRGGYILSDSKGTPDVLLLASGSEVEQMMEAQAVLLEKGIDARVVSIPCFELFNEQDEAYKEHVLPKKVRARVSMEAGVTQPWHQYVGMDGAVIGIDSYGASGKYSELFKMFGITTPHVVEEALRVLGN